MRYFDFGPTGKRTSRVGFGCGRLVGRSSLRHSAKLIETALELGVRYFDVAPSYGMGTAEEVLGEVIGDAKEVTVATKVGVPRPSYSAKADLVRRLRKSVLDRVGILRPIAQRAAMRSAQSSGERPRYDFSAAGIHASLEESLEKLRRRFVDVFLAHEPNPLDLCDEVAAGFQSLRVEGLITAFGVGVGVVGDRWGRFGSIWQSCWPGPSATQYAQDVEYIWHGAIRMAPRNSVGGRPAHPSAIVRDVLEDRRTSILVVSASTPQRLRELLGEIDP